MAKVGTRIDESGTLVREGDRLLFRRELGGRWHLDDDAPERILILGRPGRLIGTVISEGTVALERFTLEV